MAQIDKIQVGSTTYDIAPSADSTNTFTSGDVADGSASSWTTIAKLASGETTTSILGKISNMFKNIRYLYSRLGTTDISGTGTTITAAIAALESGKAASSHTHSAFTSAAAGFVPAAKSGTTYYLTSAYVLTVAGWKAGTKYNTDTDTTYAAFTSAAAGLVPAAASGSTNYATSAYVLTGAGWKAGTKYNTDSNTTYANFVGATTAAAGTAGLVPAATTYAVVTGSTTAAAGTSGLVPAPTAGTSYRRYLTPAGEWISFGAYGVANNSANVGGSTNNSISFGWTGEYLNCLIDATNFAIPCVQSWDGSNLYLI